MVILISQNVNKKEEQAFNDIDNGDNEKYCTTTFSTMYRYLFRGEKQAVFIAKKKKCFYAIVRYSHTSY